jgi:hypothetical protein
MSGRAGVDRVREDETAPLGRTARWYPGTTVSKHMPPWATVHPIYCIYTVQYREQSRSSVRDIAQCDQFSVSYPVTHCHGNASIV